MKRIAILSLVALCFVGCKSMPIKFEWPTKRLEQKIEQLEQEKKDEAAKTAAKIEEIKAQVVQSEQVRYSEGAAQVYAAGTTLSANPTQDKYTVAANKAIDVAKEALPIPTIEDLLHANQIQQDLLSEQADRIARAEKELGIIKNEVIEAKNKETELVKEKDDLITKQKQLESEYQSKIDKLNKQMAEERLAFAAERDELAQKYEYDNVWYRKYNPMTHIGKFISSLFFWVIIFVVLGGILKLLSVLFPGVGVVQVIVGGVGRAIGGFIKIIFGFIPQLFRGMEAVDYKEYKKEKTIADNSVGAIQNFRDEYPEEYGRLKEKLLDWNKDAPKELESDITEKLKKLNQI